MHFSQQVNRIKKKLQDARLRDPDLKVFGADSHKYKFNPPASLIEIKEFEAKFGVKLPEDYVAFITTIGNGGPGYYGGGGPGHGIYALGEFGFMPNTAGTMGLPAIITSSLTKEEWKELTAFEDDPELDQDSIEYERKYDLLFTGLMAIGTQGDNFQVMLALTGPDYGKVVDIDQDLNFPRVRREANFLDWYEAWLDRILAKSHS